MAKFYNEFDFIGELAIPNDEDRFLDVRDNGRGWIGHRLNFGIMQTKFNSQFVELYGGYRTGAGAKNVVYSFSKGNKDEKGKSIQIPWEDRLKQEVVDMIADFSKVVVDLETDFDKKKKYMEIAFQIRNLEYEGGDKDKLAKLKAEYEELATNRYEFIHEYDAIQLLSKKLKEHKDCKFRLQGRPELREYDGKYYTDYKPQIIEIVPESYKNKLSMKADVYFLSDAIGNANEERDYVQGYLFDYVSASKKDGLFPKTFAINKTRLDLEDDMHVGLLDFMRGQFDVKDGNLYHLPWEINIYNGAELIEGEDALTETQKNAIKFGLAKEEDYKSTTFGQNIEEYRLAKPLLHNDFADGAIESGYTEEEALELIVKPSGDVKMSEVIPEEKKEEPVEEKKEEKNVEDVIDSLFG